MTVFKEKINVKHFAFWHLFRFQEYSPLHKNQFWYLLMYPSMFWTSCAPFLLHTLVIITMCNSKGGRGSMACWKEWRKQRRFAKKKVCEVFFWINIIINFCISSIKIPKSRMADCEVHKLWEGRHCVLDSWKVKHGHQIKD